MHRTVKNLLRDDYFIDWVIKPNNEIEKFWENWVRNNPEKEDDLQKARDLILSFEFGGDRIHEELKDDLWQGIEKEIHQEPKRNGWNMGVWVRFAAGVSILLVSGLTIFQYKSHLDSNKTEAVNFKTILKEVPYGQKSTVFLLDGTKVRLNAGSSLKYPSQFDENTREVVLMGEAFFEVAEVKEKPFIVSPGKVKIQVLGTSFNIKAYPDDQGIEISVVTGKVAVNSVEGRQTQALLLQKNDRAIYNKTQESFELSSFYSEDILAWKDGILVFKNASFEEVISQLSKWYGVEFEVEKNIDGEKDFDGHFDNQSLITVMQGISFAFAFDFEVLNDQIIIK